jgi:predicted restriction endonuclease
MGMAENPAAFDHLGGSRPVQNLQRVGQDLFRRIVLTSYRGRCALTGIDDPRLLTASHILPWSAAPQMRMRPTNGLCLNALHDRAFDRHLISFDTDGRLLLSPRLSANSREQLLLGCKAKLEPPSRFAPDAELMAQHRAQFEALAA